MFRIITDSTADLSEEFLSENQITCMKLSYMVNGECYGPQKDLDSKEFYKLMRDGNMPTTSQVNPEDAKQILEELLPEEKEILVLAFSSGLSGTYNSIRLAASELMEEYPDVRIEVIDTLAASLGEGLIVYKAVMMRNEGKTFDETANWIRDHLQNFVHVFTVDDLFHLHRGGRVNKAAAIMGTLAGIKPKLNVDSEGHLVLIGKERGRKKALLSLVEFMLEKMGEYRNKNDIIFISHGDCEEDALFVKKCIEEKTGITNFMIEPIGPTIGAHAGPGTVALFFLGESR